MGHTFPGVSLRCLLGPILLRVFVRSLEEWMEFTCIESADDTK